MYTSATHVAGRFGIVQLERYNSARVAIFQTDLQRGVAEVTLMFQVETFKQELENLCVINFSEKPIKFAFEAHMKFIPYQYDMVHMIWTISVISHHIKQDLVKIV